MGYAQSYIVSVKCRAGLFDRGLDLGSSAHTVLGMKAVTHSGACLDSPSRHAPRAEMDRGDSHLDDLRERLGQRVRRARDLRCGQVVVVEVPAQEAGGCAKATRGSGSASTV